MNRVRIIVDSSTDLAPAIRERVTVQPLTVHFGDQEYVDGVTITTKEFYQKLVSCKDLPSTSQASPFAFATVFQEAVDEGFDVVAITVSSQLSGTHQSACIAAADFPGSVYVVDSKNVAISAGVLAAYAVELVDRGLSAAEIAAEITACADRVKLMAVVDTLEYLHRGGRVSKAVAIGGGLLSIKPMIALEDGQIKMAGKARGNKQANALMNKAVAELGVDYDKPILLAYTGTEDKLLREYMAQSVDLWPEGTPVTIVGSVVGTHAGPGAVAIAFFTK